MLTSDFFEQNDEALRMVNIVTRDSLGTLAALIVAANNDLTNYDADELVRQLYDVIAELHQSYKDLKLPPLPN